MNPSTHTHTHPTLMHRHTPIPLCGDTLSHPWDCQGHPQPNARRHGPKPDPYVHACRNTEAFTLWLRALSDPRPAIQIPKLLLTAAHSCTDTLQHVTQPAPCSLWCQPWRAVPPKSRGGSSLDADNTAAWKGWGGQGHPGTWELSGNAPTADPPIEGRREGKGGGRWPSPSPGPSPCSRDRDSGLPTLKWTKA